MTAPALLAGEPLAPVLATMDAMATRPHLPPLNGLAPGLLVTDTTGWVRAADLISGDGLDDLLDTAKERWQATPHAAAALAWKCYSFWLALPSVLGYAAARRVPLPDPDGVVLRWSPRQPFITVGLTSVEVAVLRTDPLAAAPRAVRKAARVRVVPDEDALIAELRGALMDRHLGLILDRLRARLHLGKRTLWGSLASGIAHGLSRAADVVPGPTLDTAHALLGGLGLDDLVDLSPREGGRPGLSVHRRTCCLAFTLPEPKICSGCCIR